MAKIHITLVGGQPAPVYNGIMAVKPEKVVFIYSQDSYDILQRVLPEINIEYQKIKLDPVDIREIDKKARELSDEFADDEVTINISSGTKVWSYFFALAFEKIANATVVFMDQNNVLWNFKDKTSSQDFVFDMHTLFRLYGNSLENNYKKFSDYTTPDFDVIRDIENIRHFNVKEFNNLLAILDKQHRHQLQHQQNGCFELQSGSYVKWEKRGYNQDDLVEIHLYKKNGQSKKTVLKSPNAIDMSFNSGWFELKVARLLSTWDQSKEICLNCKFPFAKGVDKNEVDIIINTGTKILFIECKTQITHSTDIDKFRSVVKTYGGIGSKALFITDTQMNDIAKQKCEDQGILTFALQNDNLGLSAEKALHLLLNNELYNINTQ
jgi:hypothetical protein